MIAKADDENKVRFPKIELPFSKNAGSLKSFGTAGLKAVDGHKGSYMFLSVVDPQTNAGVVSGWLTANKASGIVFSGKTEDGKAFVIPESQYGVVPFEETEIYLQLSILYDISEVIILWYSDFCQDLDIVNTKEQFLKEVQKGIYCPSGMCECYLHVIRYPE